MVTSMYTICNKKKAPGNAPAPTETYAFQPNTNSGIPPNR